eukprot:5119007-Ditylum_brightwellii.AAC.1
MEFILILGFGSLFHAQGQMQWWFTILFFTLMYHFVGWKVYLLPLVNFCHVALKEEMNNALFCQHVQHFSLTEGTLFTKPPLFSFGQYAEQPNGKSFCDGSLNLDTLDVDSYMLVFLKEIQRTPADPPEIDPTFTLKHVKDKYKNWAKKTSTSPEGRHLGLYKAWLDVPEKKKTSMWVSPQINFLEFSQPSSRYVTDTKSNFHAG